MAIPRYNRMALRSFSRTAQRGVGLADVMFGLLIAAILGVGLYKLYSSTTSTGKTNSENDALVQVTGTVQARCKAGGTYGTSGYDLAACLIKNDQVPGGWTVNGTAITNSFGGAVSIKSTVAGFTLSTGGMPDSACHDIAISASGSFKNASTSINSGATSSTPVTDQIANSGCTAGDTNSVMFTFPY